MLVLYAPRLVSIAYIRISANFPDRAAARLIGGNGSFKNAASAQTPGANTFAASPFGVVYASGFATAGSALGRARVRCALANHKALNVRSG